MVYDKNKLFSLGWLFRFQCFSIIINARIRNTSSFLSFPAENSESYMDCFALELEWFSCKNCGKSPYILKKTSTFLYRNMKYSPITFRITKSNHKLKIDEPFASVKCRKVIIFCILGFSFFSFNFNDLWFL